MKLKVIYEPAGRAREYAPLACNPWIGCTGGCVYCYAKHMARKTAEEFHKDPMPRANIVDLFEMDCQELQKKKDDRVIFLSFMCDPFQKLGIGRDTHIYKILKAAWMTNRKIRTLTKVPSNVLFDDIRGFIDFGVSFSGATYLGTAPDELEPQVDGCMGRLGSLYEAKTRGHSTWVSMEPVINVDVCLNALKKHGECVDFWRIGKLNGRDNAMKKIEHSIDWKAFGKAVRYILPPEKYMLKEDLLREMGEL